MPYYKGPLTQAKLTVGRDSFRVSANQEGADTYCVTVRPHKLEGGSVTPEQASSLLELMVEDAFASSQSSLLSLS